jgi:hypothetical protein
MKRKLVLVIIFVLYGGLTARAENLHVPVSGIGTSEISATANIFLRDISCRPVDIRTILEDVKPQKIDIECLRNSRITEYSL